MCFYACSVSETPVFIHTSKVNYIENGLLKWQKWQLGELEK